MGVAGGKGKHSCRCRVLWKGDEPAYAAGCGEHAVVPAAAVSAGKGTIPEYRSGHDCRSMAADFRLAFQHPTSGNAPIRSRNRTDVLGENRQRRCHLLWQGRRRGVPPPDVQPRHLAVSGYAASRLLFADIYARRIHSGVPGSRFSVGQDIVTRAVCSASAVAQGTSGLYYDANRYRVLAIIRTMCVCRWREGSSSTETR
jgi:hypothetical protein